MKFASDSTIIYHPGDVDVILLPHFLLSFLPLSEVIVEFEPNSYTVEEDEGVVRFSIVKRTQTTQDVTVQFTTQDGSATCM